MFHNNISSKSLIRHPIITFCMLCSLPYRLFLESMFFLLYYVFWTNKAVNGWVISSNIHVMPWLSNMQTLRFLTLRWRTFTWWGNEDMVRCFGWKRCHYMVYKLLTQSDSYITQDARPKIVDALLMFISRMAQGACRCCFGSSRQPLPDLRMSATNRHLDNT